MGAEIDRLELSIEAQASKADKQLDKLVAKLENLSNVLDGLKIDKLGNIGSKFEKAISGASRANNSFISLSKSMISLAGSSAKAKSSVKSLSQVWGSFYASFFPIIRGVKQLGKSIESSMDYIETFNYFNVTMDKIGKEFSNQYEKYGYDSAESYSNSFSGRLNDLTKKMTGYKVGNDGVLKLSNDMNLGLDPNQIMNYQASVSAITNSVGLVGETSVNASKALSMLAADMSSFKNVNLSTVMTNMQSGLIGQSRALYKYGIDITNATLQTYAYKYGLSTAVSEMTQADKMQLRLLAILDQSKIAWGDQANTINSVANQYRILKQQISNVSRVIGNILMPVIQAALPLINGLLIAVQRLLTFVGGLLKIDFSKIMDGISPGYSGSDLSDLSEDADGVSSNLTDANDAAKKLQRTLLGFDQINKLNDNTDTSGSGASSDGGAGGIDLSNEIAAALSEYEDVWNKAFENSLNKAQEYADKITNVFSNMWGLIKSRDYIGLGEYIAGGVDLVFEKINSVFNWNEIGPGITEFVDGYCSTINSLVDNIDWQNIGATIGDGINVITNSLYLYLTGIDWISLGVAFADGLNGMIDSVDWLKLGQTIGAWIMKIPKIIYGFVTTLDWEDVGTAIGNALNGVLMEFDGATIAGGINGIVNGMITALKNFIKTVDWSEVAKAVGDVLGNLDWGTLSSIGLAVAAVKLAGVIGGLVRVAFSESIKEAFKSGLNKIFPEIGKLLSNTKIGEIISLTTGGAGTLSESIVTVLGSSVSTIATVIGGIALVVAGIIDLWNTSETFRDNVSNMLSIIGGAFLIAKQQIWDNGLKPLWDSIKELFGSLYEIYESSGLKEIFEAVVTAIGYIASIAIGGIIVAIGNFVKFLANGVQAIVETLTIVLGFVKGFFSEHEDTISGIKQIWSGLTEFLAGVFSGDWSRAWTGIKTVFKGVWDTFVSIVKIPINKVIDILNSFLTAVQTVANSIGEALSFKIDLPKSVEKATGVSSFGINIPKAKIPKIPHLASGGVVNTGEMFVARENGLTEMVGRIGNRATVANNDQIVNGIAYGVKEAVVDAVAEVAVAMNGGHGKDEMPVIEVTVKCDSETLYKATQKGKKKADRRYQVVVPVG